MESRGNFGDLIGGVGLKMFEVFDQALTQYHVGISNLLTVTSVTGAQENYTGLTGSGELRKFDGDGEDIGTTRRYKSYTTKALWTNYGQSIEVSYNQLEDNDFQAELDAMHHMGIASNMSQDRSGVQLFNGGFTTSTTVNGYDVNLYGDGKPTFSTLHGSTVPGASTQSNASSTGIALGDDNIEVGRVALTLQRTDDGMPSQLIGKATLVVPVAMEKLGMQLTMSEYVAENANNAINVYKNGAPVDMVSSQYLDSVNGGSNVAWFLFVPGRTRFMHAVRQAPMMRQSINERNLVSTFSVNARWSEVVKDWKGSWGSKGDLAAYSS